MVTVSAMMPTARAATMRLATARAHFAAATTAAPAQQSRLGAIHQTNSDQR
jgi:hypothetical protein